MFHTDYDRKDSVEKIGGRESQGDWRQEELIGGNPPVVKESLGSGSAVVRRQ
jgi:hypothetical protein